MNRRTTITLAALLLASWAALHAADAGGPVRSFDPKLWVSPDGRLFDFWAQREKGRRDAELGVWCIEPEFRSRLTGGHRGNGD